MISEIARSSYYSPLGLATKALMLDSLKKEQKAFDDEDNIILPDFYERIYRLLDMAKDEPQSIIEKYNIREFKGSKSWVFRYMIHHGLSYRKVHYERRCIIDYEQVDYFLKEIADAVITYGGNVRNYTKSANSSSVTKRKRNDQSNRRKSKSEGRHYIHWYSCYESLY